MTFEYDRFLNSKGKKYKAQAKVSGLIDSFMREQLGIDLSVFMDGILGSNFTYTDFGSGNQNIDFSATLDDAKIFVDTLGYNKPLGDIGRVDLDIDLKNEDVVKISNLNVVASGLDIHGGVLNFNKGQLSGGVSKNMVIGETKGDFDFTVDGNNLYRLNADLQSIDLRALIGDDEKENSGQDIDFVAFVKSNVALSHADKVIKNVQIYLDRDREGRFRQFELDAEAGTGNVYLRYKPDMQGVRRFRFEADDAGATLAAFGLYKNIKGGEIIVHAEPTPEDVASGNLLGVAKISNFNVVDAPTLAKMLSLASFEGFAKGLTEEGISFEKLETRFDWQYRPEGSLLVLEQGGSSGSAVGLTFDGTIDQSQGMIDVSGTVVPMSQINNLIGSIPLIGQVLTGGSGVFAATYKVKGKTSDPEISINPLSVLAPGILRRILFE